MATRVTTSLVDDTDGSEAQETVSFALEGTTYEIDLSDQNAKKLRDALEPWVSKARKTGGGRRRARSDGAGKADLKAVRDWAASNKIELSRRGRIPRTVIEQYHAAGN
jgi:Lsr2